MRREFNKEITAALRAITCIMAIMLCPVKLFANEKTAKLTWTTFQDKKLAIAVTYPSNTHPKINYAEKIIDLYSNTASQSADPLVSLTIYSGDFNHVNQELGMFSQRGRQWVTTWGRNLAGSTAENFSTVNGHGLIASVICGITDNDGHFHASGDCLLGIISDGKSSIEISTANLSGWVISEKTVKKIIHSLRFLESEDQSNSL